MALLKDKLWLWGHPEGRYNNEFGNTEISRMTPFEGATYLDCSGVFMVPAGAKVNRRQYHLSFTTLDRVGWDLLRSDDGDPEAGAGKTLEVVEELINEAKEFPNVTCGVFDDFFANGRFKCFDIKQIEKTRDLLHANNLDMWMVLYTHEFGVNEKMEEEFKPYADLFDGVIMWTWCEKDVVEFEEKYELFKKVTQGKRKMLGLYLYNFGEHKKATAEKVLWQLERYSKLLKKGEIEGICLHTNTMADLNHQAYKACKEWLNIHKNDIVPD